MLLLLQAKIKEDAPIVNQTIREARFRTRFDAAVVHIRRDGKQLEGQLGSAELRAGDEARFSAHFALCMSVVMHLAAHSCAMVLSFKFAQHERDL